MLKRAIVTAGAIAALAAANPAWAGPEDDFRELREEMWQAALDASPTLATRWAIRAATAGWET